MATNQNLFEKYGIKDVANVTFYRIDKKKETYESQRKIYASSILRGALKLMTVYPNDGTGVGAEDGFEAYVFEDANLLTHKNYECDDTTEEKEKTIIHKTSVNPNGAKLTVAAIFDLEKDETIDKNSITNGDEQVSPIANLGETEWTYTATVKYTVKKDGSPANSGTHEFSYAEQILMLYAKNQNLLTRAGARYTFSNADTYFGNIDFSEDFYDAPGSDSKVIVVGLTGKFAENFYDIDEINEEIEGLKTAIAAKAYDIEYSDYAELVVEDEMGYFDPKFLGKDFKKNAQGIGEITHFENGEAYSTWSAALKGTDEAIANATTWGKAEHDSINDAIDALKQKKVTIDNEEENGLKGIKKISGGYKVQDNKVTPGTSDTDVAANKYTFGDTGITSNYSLQSVLDALTKISYTNTGVMDELKVSAAGNYSNRAIYVRVDGEVDMSAGARLYILTNKNTKTLLSDKEGIFYFTDKKGNTVYYQDKIFAGVEHLALVIIGDKGLIFVANRCGYRKNNAVGWIVSRKGYPSNEHCKRIVENGIVHTVPITANDETFEATCTVSKMGIRRIVKDALHYTPVLFLDSLKVSTIEQTADETYATGGSGNANLIGWDFNKSITLTLQDALYTPASMSAMVGNEGANFVKGVKDTKHIDRMEPVTAKRSFIIPAGNINGFPSEGDISAQAVFIDPNTMEPYRDGTPIAEGERFLKWTRSVAYKDNSIGNTIEISADKFPGTYRIVGDTFARSKATGEDERFMFIVPQAKMTSDMTITLEADGDPSVFDMSLTVLRPDDGIMMKLVQYDVVENTEENDGSTMVKNTENLNLLDDAEMFKVNSDYKEEETFIGATEY